MTRPELSVFWYNGYRFFGWNAQLDDEDVITVPSKNLCKIKYDHKKVWKKLKKSFKDNPRFDHILKHDYRYYTRGKVVYNTQRDQYIVYCDAWIATSDKCRKVVSESCNLPENTRFVVSTAYKCNPESLHECDHVDADGFLIKED